MSKTEVEIHPVKCPLLPNWSTQKDGHCKRYAICYTQERTKDPQCPAKGGV